jgi:hypothetical protein
LETAKFIFTPPELPAVGNAGKQPSRANMDQNIR